MNTIDTLEWTLRDMEQEIHATAISKKWWDPPASKAEHLLLMHSEVGEATKALREGAMEPSDHIPAFGAIEEELADVVIRAFDMAAGYNYDIVGAIIAKMEFNKTRPKKHGGKAF